MTQYDTWEENFQQLLNWKATVMKKSPNNVIELDVLSSFFSNY
jgi:hypothetical protein